MAHTSTMHTRRTLGPGAPWRCRTDSRQQPPGRGCPLTVENGPNLPGEAEVRGWLRSLRQPDRLAETSLVPLLREQGRIDAHASGVELGEAAAAALIAAIERLRPAPGSSREAQLPYLVLQNSFLAGMKSEQSASRLRISTRQLSRYRTRAIQLLGAELARAPAATPATYRFPPVPAISDFQPRPALTRGLLRALAEQHYVHVHGHSGIGKTALVADLVVNGGVGRPVLWHRFRTGLNDSLGGLIFELAEHLRTRGRPNTAVSLAASIPNADLNLLIRLLVRELDGVPSLVVLDDYHVVEADGSIGAFLDDAVTRLPDFHVITIGRHSDPPAGARVTQEIRPMTRLETQSLLEQLGVKVTPELASSIQRWTAGLPQLIRLAASWLRTVSEADVKRGLAAFNELEEVQDFLLSSIAELIGSADRSVLDAASVFRARFNDGAVAHVAGLSVGTVRDTSRRLVKAHVGTRSREGGVAFFHISVREYFYSRLTPEQRIRLHQRAEEWSNTAGLDDEAEYHRRVLEDLEVPQSSARTRGSRS
jgi:hypothetical protein